ncbi:MAG: hypothetical protein ACREP9_07060, partial [Candidatus Dormibacteraceae bacterium]
LPRPINKDPTINMGVSGMVQFINISSRSTESWISELPKLDSNTPVGHSQKLLGRTTGGARVEVLRVRSAVAAAHLFVERLRQLHQAAPPNLIPLAGAAEQGSEVWLLFRPVTAVPLPRLLNSGLGMATGLAIGLAVLRGLTALHKVELGVEVEADSIVIDALGTIRLAGGWTPIASGEAVEQVSRVGQLLAKLLNLTLQPSAELQTTERQAPALAAAVRTLAAGQVDNAHSALELISETAGGLSAEPQLQRIGRQLATSVRESAKPSKSTSQPPSQPAPESTTPALPPASSRREQAKPIAIGPRPTKESAWRAKPPPRRSSITPRMLGIGGLAALLILVVGLGFSFRSFFNDRFRASVSAPAASNQSSTPSSSPSSQPPPAAGQVKEVDLAFDQPSPCVIGDKICRLRVDVKTQPVAQGTDIAWVFSVRNACNGTTSQLAGTDVTTDGQGWTAVYSSSVATLPQGNQLQITAQTTQPAAASSQPLTIGQSC